MSRPPQEWALRFQLAMIAGNEPASSYLEIRFKRQTGGMGRVFIGSRERDRAMRAIVNGAQVGDVYIGAAPRAREDGSAAAVERVWCLWADCDTPEAVQRLRDFRPEPSMVIQSGTAGHLHAWWQLQAAVPPHIAVRANRRLAHALAADMASTDAARILRPAGTLSHKHDPPRLVACTELPLNAYTISQVAATLPDPPRDRPAPRPSNGAHRIDYDATLEGLLRTAADAQPGNRNCALFWAACRVAEHDLDSPQVRHALANAAASTGLEEHEINATLRSALDRTAP